MAEPAGNRRRAAIGACVYGAGLAYLSLARGGGWSCAGAWLAESFAREAPLSRADLLANVVAYLPLGALLASSFGGRGRRAAAAATLAAALLSLAVELLQACLPARTSSLIDLAANAGGAAAGALMSGFFAALLRPDRPPLAGWRLRLAAPPLPALAALVLAAWFADRTFPWVLTADLGQVRQNLAFLKPLLAGRAPLDGWRLAGHVAGWLVLGLALRAGLRPWAPVLRLTLLAMAGALVVQVGLAVPTLSLEELAAAALALPALALLRLPALVRILPYALALAAFALVTAFQLRPGTGAAAAAFSWLPRFGGGSPLNALGLGVFYFAFAFSCALAWAWRQAGPAAVAGAASERAVLVAAAVSVGWLLLLEFAQVRIPGRTADTSPPLLAAAGWAIALSVRRRPAEAPAAG